MHAARPQTAHKRALGLLGGRVGLVALTTVLVWLPALLFDREAAYPPSPMLVTLGLLPVNLISLWVVVRLLRRDGQTLRDLFVPRRGLGFLADLGRGLLWIAVLYIPFVGAIIATMWLLHGANTFTSFQTVFVNPDAASVTSPLWALVLGILAVVTFAPLNAPAEEAVYRAAMRSPDSMACGHGQQRSQCVRSPLDCSTRSSHPPPTP